jgi:hypothetical protein
VKARASLSASTPELISTLGDIRFEARLKVEVTLC